VSQAPTPKTDTSITAPASEEKRSTQRFPEATLFSMLAADLSRSRGDFVTAARLITEQAIALKDEPLFLEASWLTYEYDPQNLQYVLSSWHDNFPESDSQRAFIAQISIEQNSLNEAFDVALTIKDPAIASPFFQRIASIAMNWRYEGKLQVITLFENARNERPDILGLDIGIALIRSTIDAETAIQELESLHETNPDATNITLALTGILANNDQLQRAHEILEDSLDRRFNLDLATQQAKLSYYLEAETDGLTHLIDNAEDTPVWYRDSAQWALERGFTDDASTLTETLARYNYFTEDATLLHGRLSLTRGEFQAAIEYFSSLSRPDLRSQAVQYTLSEVNASDEYEQFAGQLTSISRSNLDVEYAWVNHLNSISTIEQRLPRLELTHQLINSSASLEFLVNELRSSGMDLTADQMMLRFIEQNPTSAWTMNNLAYSWITRDIRLDEARTLLNEAVSLNPEDAATIDSLGWLEYKLGNVEAALPLIERANALETHPEIMYHLAIILRALGNDERYQELMDRLQQLFPNYPVSPL
jgi:tetratricopeptide (TPR) repeat protein